MPTKFDLKTLEGLAAACRFVDEHKAGRSDEWSRALREFFDWVASADQKTRATLAFQQRLWDDNPVSATGQGQIPVTDVLNKPGFRTWIAERSMRPLPADRAGRTAAHIEFYDELVRRFDEVLPRIPHLKIFRVLAAFAPDDFTSIAHRGTLERLVRRMRGVAGENPVALHAYVRDRLDEVLGPPSDAKDARIARFKLPWFLYEIEAGEETTTARGARPGDDALLPLPAIRRRKGLTAIAGGFPTVLDLLQELREGLPREDFLDYLRARYPTQKEASRKMIINVLRSELGLVKNVDDKYLLTERGLAVLETSSADEVGEWLLTRVLGVDHVVKALARAPSSKLDLVSLLRTVNTGWTTDFAPTAMINWLVSMGAVKRSPDGLLRLTELGQEWSERIAWTPEVLPPDEMQSVDGEAITSAAAAAAAESEGAELPPLRPLVVAVCARGAFPAALVEQLHLGLWSPRRRHFAVLAGVSGSGKTLLASSYAEELTSAPGDGASRIMIQAVQPGWYDATALLGYLNPLQRDTYQRTEFLNFLIKASQDPKRPYVLILDEMNLSHPEQYFAPLLSAMETGRSIQLHAEGEEIGGVPQSIAYPANLAIIGTVNMDETTHGLSDKVLDRAYTLEFWDINIAEYRHWDRAHLSSAETSKLKALLSELVLALSPSRLQFAWRIVDDVVAYLATANRLGASTPFEELLDSVIYAKVLPKLRGEDSPRLSKSLDDTQTIFRKFGLTRCADRTASLREELQRTGSVRFWR